MRGDGGVEELAPVHLLEERVQSSGPAVSNASVKRSYTKTSVARARSSQPSSESKRTQGDRRPQLLGERRLRACDSERFGRAAHGLSDIAWTTLMDNRRNFQPGDVLSFGPFSLFAAERLL